ncbi:hypothetical protein C8D87_102778 [Lentzea atacamensis]|uniref:Uncharacterized protein n=1 Tax=Lentzea atacamensis TaxID=531938 RepID=A0ABX9EH50_9PSEU|nr:hypothetical protein [Lentzea atacamensis]RAS68705.1 hypothetical protein C8D87_102778 [Lentzea atacamensis]
MKADCSAPQAMHRLAASPRSSSPSSDYLADTGNRSRKSKKQSKDCYTGNVREGDCLTLAEVGEFTLYQRVACGLSPNKVTKVVAGKADEKLCTTGDDSYVYLQPASTVCISKV